MTKHVYHIVGTISFFEDGSIGKSQKPHRVYRFAGDYYPEEMMDRHRFNLRPALHQIEKALEGKYSQTESRPFGLGAEAIGEALIESILYVGIDLSLSSKDQFELRLVMVG